MRCFRDSKVLKRFSQAKTNGGCKNGTRNGSGRFWHEHGKTPVPWATAGFRAQFPRLYAFVSFRGR